MPTLREFLHHLAHEFAPGLDQGAAESSIRKVWGGTRVYIPPADSRQDPERAEAIRQAAAQLPTRVVAERLGVSESYVRRVRKMDE